ncbi:hypothetical protein AMATHDRAFT_55276, partial [Amanita thiersii Skay4041]
MYGLNKWILMEKGNQVSTFGYGPAWSRRLESRTLTFGEANRVHDPIVFFFPS